MMDHSQWKRVNDSKIIETYITQRIIQNLQQVEGIPCIIDPLRYLLGIDNCTPVLNYILLGTVDLDSLPLTKQQKITSPIK